MDLKYLFLAEFGVPPFPPLTENRSAKRPLKEFPPPRPLDEKNSLSSILRVLNRNRWFCSFGLVDSV